MLIQVALSKILVIICRAYSFFACSADQPANRRWRRQPRGTARGICRPLPRLPTIYFVLLHSGAIQTHPFNGPLSGTTRVSRYQKGKPIWILLKQETVSGSGISWAVCKTAPRSRQITMPAPHHFVFLQAGCPSCRPTNSVKALKA